jgi:AcrR family transcriptional regulator
MKQNTSDTNNKEIIIAAARDIFCKYGYKKTTMDDIGRIIGKGKTSLYYYFKNKEEIFEAVLAFEIDLIKNELFDALDSERNPQKKLRKYILKRMELYFQLVNFYSAIQKEYLENLTVIEKIRQQYDDQELTMISGIIEEGIHQGYFVAKDIQLTAYAIILAMKGFEYPFSKEKDIHKLEADIDQLLEVLFYGLLKR